MTEARLGGADGVPRMLRIFLFVIALGVLLGIGAVIYLGAFPPNPHPHTVEKTLPNDKLGH